MIRINLLPPGERKPEFTPRPQMALIVAFFAVLTLTGFYGFALVVFRVPELEDMIQAEKSKHNDLKNEVNKHGILKSKISKLTSKIKEIDTVTGRPVEFWRSLDSIWAVVQNNPKVWLDEIQFLDKGKMESEYRKFNPGTRPTRGQGPEYGLKLSCYGAGESAYAMTNFRKGLRENPYLGEKFEIMNFDPQWDLNDEEEYVDAYSISFETIIFPKVLKNARKSKAKTKKVTPPKS